MANYSSLVPGASYREAPAQSDSVYGAAVFRVHRKTERNGPYRDEHRSVSASFSDRPCSQLNWQIVLADTHIAARSLRQLLSINHASRHLKLCVDLDDEQLVEMA